jgi:hypothetical protein
MVENWLIQRLLVSLRAGNYRFPLNGRQQNVWWTVGKADASSESTLAYLFPQRFRKDSDTLSFGRVHLQAIQSIEVNTAIAAARAGRRPHLKKWFEVRVRAPRASLLLG